jgi:hypothetical protein
MSIINNSFKTNKICKVFKIRKYIIINNKCLMIIKIKKCYNKKWMDQMDLHLYKEYLSME